MNLANQTLLSTITIIISLIALYFSLLQYLVSKDQKKISNRSLSSLKWSQMSRTLDMLSEWHGPHMTEVKNRVRKHIDYHNNIPCNMEALINIDNFNELYIDIVNFLSYLDLMCLSYQKNAIDNDMCFRYMCLVVVNINVTFQPFIEHVRNKACHIDKESFVFCGHLETVGKEWNKKLDEDNKIISDVKKSIRYADTRVNPMDDGQ